jgi:hypothetical protein
MYQYRDMKALMAAVCRSSLRLCLAASTIAIAALIFANLTAVLPDVATGFDEQLRGQHKRHIYARFIDGGQSFRFIVHGLRAAFAPHRLLFVSNSTKEPDVVIFSVWGTEYLKHPSARKILMIGEPVDDFEPGCPVDVTIHCIEGVGKPYVPFWVMSFGERRRNFPKQLLKSHEAVADAISRKDKFCAFLYSHASPLRDRLFDAISSYKQVDALGAAKSIRKRHQTDRLAYRHDVTYNDLAVQKYLGYKFVIAGESQIRRGYITEKIISAMLAYAIPIYVGAPEIASHFNPGSIIVANNMTDSDLLRLIKLLDTNLTAYSEMLHQPWFTSEALPGWFTLENQTSPFRILAEKILA